MEADKGESGLSTMTMKDELDEREELRKYLFIRGFLMTDNAKIDGANYPFYGEWNQTWIQGFCFWTHRLTGFHYVEKDDKIVFLLGHAYNPFTMEYDENAILTRLLKHVGLGDFYDYVDELTGIFVLGILDSGRVQLITDPSGMQSASCGVVDGVFYMTSHPQLVGDLCNLSMSPFVKELTEYKWYGRVMGPYLPADLTPFEELKRIIPNIEYTYEKGAFRHRRFYPLKDLKEVANEEEYRTVIQEAADILRNGMKLVSRKWKNPWISLTGGIDSNTTFAAGVGNYDKFQTFSYYSAEKEAIDCEAAKKIAEHFRVPWTLYHIPENTGELKDYETKYHILMHNNSYVARTPDNEVRKRIFLEENFPADVEVKSWVSETIRAYWYKHYGRKNMPPLSGRLFRNLYKIFTTDRSLAHKVDHLFECYISDYEYDKIPKQYPPADMHYNEVTWGSWGGINISEMKFYTEITIVYNNRRFLDLLFRVPLEKRISDQHHLDMKKYLNPDLYGMGIRVVNQKETKFRARCLNAIFTLNMKLPF